MEDKKLLLWKVESVYGTDVTPAAADVLWAENVDFKPMGEMVEGDPAMAGLGGVKGQTVGEYGMLTFEIPLGGSGTAGTAPKWGKVLLAAGYAETVVAVTSVTYALAANPAAGTSASIYWRDGRRKHVMLGSRGVCSFAFNEKQRPVMKCSFMGLRTNVADGAVIAHADATWTGWNDVEVVSNAKTTFTFNAVASAMRAFSIDQSNNLVFSDRPAQKQVDIAGKRTFSGNVKISTPLPSVLSIEALKTANTLVTATLVHGLTAGSILTLTAKGQCDNPSYSKDSGLDVTDFGFNPKPSTLAVDDQVAIVCT